MVGPESGPLTTIVSQDPMYVTFPVSQREFLKAQEDRGERDPKSIKVRIRFSDGSVYDQLGVVNFIDVSVDRTTDTVTARATIPNPRGVLIDGQLVRVLLEGGAPKEEVVIPQSALIADQQGVYVFVVEEHKRFLQLCPEVERYIVGAGIQLIKIWLEVNKDEQARRMAARLDDPLRQWKLSPMDVKSWGRWYEYSRARDMMFEATDTEASPWHILRSDDKRRARLNCIAHILTLIPYKKIARSKVKLPKRTNKGKYDDEASLRGRRVIPAKY